MGGLGAYPLKNANVRKTMPCLPPMTGKGKHATYKNGDDWGMVYYCFTHIGGIEWYWPMPVVSKGSWCGEKYTCESSSENDGFSMIIYIDVGLLEEGYGKKRVTQIPVGICLIPSHGRIDFRYVQPHSTVDASWCIYHHMFTTIRSWPSSQPPYVMSLTSHVGTM